MERENLAWTVIGVAVGVIAFAFPDMPGPVRTVLGFLAVPMLAYGVVRQVRPDRPKSVTVTAKLVSAGRWHGATGFIVELEVVVDWNQPLQLRFELLLPDGTTIDHARYQQVYVTGKAGPEFIENPKEFAKGHTGPNQIAFMVPESVVSSKAAPRKGLQLRYRSVLPKLVKPKTMPLPFKRPHTDLG